MLFDGIIWAVFVAFYTLLVRLPLIFLNVVLLLFNLIAIGLPQYLLFGISLNGSFNNISLPLLFIRLSIISVIVFVILFVISAIRIHFQKGDEPNPIRIAMKNSIMGTIWLIVIPLVLFAIHSIFNVILTLILGKETASISHVIFLSLRNAEWKNISSIEWEKMAINNFVFDYEVYNKLQTGQGSVLIIIGGLVSIATLIPLLLGLLTLVQKIFQMFFLFVISPFIASASVSDDGKRMKQFQEMYMAKTVSILAIIISLQLFAAFLSRASNWVFTLELLNKNSELDYYAKMLLILGLSAGGAVGAAGISSEITAFVGESTSVRETLGETKNLISQGISLGGAVGAVGGFAKNAGLRFAKGRSAVNFSRDKKNLKKKLKSGHILSNEYKEGLNKLYSQRQADDIHKFQSSENVNKFKNDFLKAHNDFNNKISDTIPEQFQQLNLNDFKKSEFELNEMIKFNSDKIKANDWMIKNLESNNIDGSFDSEINRIKQRNRELTTRHDNLNNFLSIKTNGKESKWTLKNRRRHLEPQKNKILDNYRIKDKKKGDK
ncbi:hypothetical protein MFERI15181_00785 [Mycoplasma feriruminatoris]|uniref:Uncharacterized protein n=1 Tax=Mycoplasma feriruminatoris TaxID=1179777 RepID=A0ABY8HXF1_9MOLU|nr:hypothetical protein [Mycoplasma feriruminatoris]WFQ93864.1 hypothetical protein MFERI15181_00785 [Mycoplasma feriruminatoris]